VEIKYINGLITTLTMLLIIVILLNFIRNLEFFKYIFLKYIKPFCTWRILVCYFPFWFIATGWAYVVVWLKITWLRGAALGWLAFMWLPFSQEKMITIPLTIWLHKKLFPKHSTSNLEIILEKKKGKTNDSID